MSLTKLGLIAGPVLMLVLALAGVRGMMRQAAAQARRAQAEGAAAAPGRHDQVSPTSPGQGEMAILDVALNDKNVESFRLENGLKVLLRPIRGAHNTALVVVYSIGNDHDPDGQSGLGHMVEHVYVTAAAGDRKPRTAQEFASHYPQGANGQTGDRYTVFSTVFPRQDLEVELREAADRMGNLHITTADVDRERPRILEETENMFGSIPTLGAQNHARELIRSTPKGGRRGGQPAQIQALTVENLRDQWQRFYKPRNAIIAVSGALDAAAARKLITTHFGGLAPGTLIPSPAAPDAPHFGVHREFTVKPADPDALPMACLAYATPAPGSDLYAPFLVLVMRLWVSSAKLGNGPMGSQVYFTPLDDGAIVGISSPLKPGESVPKTIARLEAFVNETIAPELTDPERVAARQQLGLLLGFADVPDPVLGRNPYGVAFSLARRVQLGLDSAQLDRALSTITDQDLRRAADAVFAPSKHSGAFILLEK